jgi:hypothetical protein
MPNEIIEELKTVSDVPIFKVGVHNGVKYSKSDLNQMVDNFYTLKKENKDYKIPIKIGHDAFGEPEKSAIGWLDNLRVDGKFLTGDYTDLDSFGEVIVKSKSFKNRSVEIHPDYETYKGEKIGLTVLGLSLLGGSMPAVNLPDIKFKHIPESIMHSLQSDQIVTFSIDIESDKSEEGETTMGSENDQVDKVDEPEAVLSDKTIEMQSQIDDLTGKLRKFEELLGNFKNADEIVNQLKAADDYKKSTDQKIADFNQYKLDLRKKENGNFVSELINNNQLLPKDQESVTVILNELDPEKIIEFSDSTKKDLKEKVKMLDVFKQFLSNLPKIGLIEEYSKKGEPVTILSFAEEKGFGKFETEKILKEKLTSTEYQKLFSMYDKVKEGAF